MVRSSATSPGDERKMRNGRLVIGPLPAADRYGGHRECEGAGRCRPTSRPASLRDRGPAMDREHPFDISASNVQRSRLCYSNARRTRAAAATRRDDKPHAILAEVLVVGTFVETEGHEVRQSVRRWTYREPRCLRVVAATCRVVIAVDAEWTPTATSATLGTSLRLRG